MKGGDAQQRVRAQEAYLRTTVGAASPLEQRRRLLEMAITCARSVAQCLRSGRRGDAHSAATRTRKALLALATGVRTEEHATLGELILRLHVYMHGRITQAVLTRDPALADEVVGLLEQEHAAWTDLLKGRRDAG